MRKLRRNLIVLLLSVATALSLSVAMGHAASPSDVVSETGSAYYGASVSVAGDVNGDGYDDVICGASGLDSGLGDQQGGAYVYYGSASGLSTVADWSFLPDKAQTLFGTSVGTAGDVNKDGFDDVIVGAPRYNTGEGPNQGRVYVFYGSDKGLHLTPDSDSHQRPESWRLWLFSGNSGDVNKDGFDDVIVGAPSYTVDQTWEGRVFIYPGSKDGLSKTAWTLDGNNDYSRFGASVSKAGDINNDGYDDVIVGGFQYGYPATKGGAFVYYGSATGVVTSTATAKAWSSLGTQTDARYGSSVAAAGDVNRDGYDDIAVAESLYDDGATENVGRVFVFYGSELGPSSSADWVLTGENASEGLGPVASAGDVNKDSYDDLIVGGSGYNPSATLSAAGRARIYFGSSQGLAKSASWTVSGGQESGRFGNAVRSAGDVDNNGYVDIIVGEYYYDGTSTDEGRAHVYCGAATGLSMTPCWTGGPGDAAISGQFLYLPTVVRRP